VAEPSTKRQSLSDKLRSLRWWCADHEPESAWETDAVAVLEALRGGDEVLTRRLADLVREQATRQESVDDLGVRDHWFEELGNWDGVSPTPEDMADRFVYAMASFLKRYREGERRFGQPAWTAVSTPERVKAVRLAFETTFASRFYERNRGRSLLSAGLRGLGVPADEVEGALDFIRKR
jgi:hypothetical protein